MMLLASIQFGLSDVLADFLSMSSFALHQHDFATSRILDLPYLDYSIRVEIVYRNGPKLDAKDFAILARPLVQQ